MEDAENLSISCASSTLLKSLYCGVQWLRSASEVIFISSKLKRCKLSDVEEVLTGYQVLNYICLCSCIASINILGYAK